ncbi:hypothetical protein GALL_41660 [mine drainage metagenome]|uniref:Uncharacterized protein n=1 Tax=mine drainage metagenome TaxID=410659 RepID=A0A1J5T2M5_9ZZZZ
MWRAYLIVLLSLSTWVAAQTAAPRVGLIKVEGAIGPATAGYVSRAVDRAGDGHFECLVIQLDTPGGLLDSTKTIVQKLLAARVPVVVYVAPEGATAASAGCFIALAADVAAMAPATSIGAAHPVEIGAAPGQEESKGENTFAKKLENYSATYIESIAAKRGRNVEWARSAVKESAALTADKALAEKVVDLVAPNLDALLAQLDGRRVGDRELHTRGAEIIPIPMTLREATFQLLWRPEVLVLLAIIAIYGLIGELSNPGTLVPGIVGSIALVLALYMGAVLPINFAGVALIVLAAVLFVADAFASTHGALTVGGGASLLLGALMLFDASNPAFRISLAFALPAAVITTLFSAFVLTAGLRAQRLPVRAGRETLIGRTAPALTRIDTSGGALFVEGERWNAVSDTPIEPGQPAVVVGLTGLTLTVKPQTKDPSCPTPP